MRRILPAERHRRRCGAAGGSRALPAPGFADRAWRTRASRGELRAYRAGFDLFSFAGNARLLTFDLFGFVDGLARRFARHGIRGTISASEQFGALAAALLAQRAGLPGTDPRAVLARRIDERAALRASYQAICERLGWPATSS